MAKGKIKAVLFIIVFVLVIAVACSALMDMTGQSEPESTVDPFLVSPSPEAGQASPSPSQTVAPTVVPSPTAAPTPTPILTPPPMPSTTPAAGTDSTGGTVSAGQSLGSGSFSSQTGLPIDIRADWTATALDSERVRVTVTVVLESYALQIAESYNAVNVSVGDQYASCNAPAVDYDGSTKLETTLGTTSHTLYLSAGQSDSFPLAVEYHFGGTYSGEELPVIECGGSIQLSR